MKNDKDFVVAIVKIHGYNLKHASKDLKNDKEVVLEAIKNNGWSLCYAS